MIVLRIHMFRQKKNILKYARNLVTAHKRRPKTTQKEMVDR